MNANLSLSLSVRESSVDYWLVNKGYSGPSGEQPMAVKDR
jgi:hypothetical protein